MGKDSGMGMGGSEQAGLSAVAPTPRRTRIVLAEVSRHGAPRDGLQVELTEQTAVGAALIKGLIRAQLALAMRLATVVAVGLGSLPLLFAVAPGLGSAKLLGIGLPWLVLGVLAFPFLVVVGWVYLRLAERNEKDFADLIRRPER